jgi:hypothetical protein
MIQRVSTPIDFLTPRSPRFLLLGSADGELQLLTLLSSNTNELSSLCPGIHYAEASIYITIVSILAAYTISKAKDEHGEEITPSTEGVAESVV